MPIVIFFQGPDDPIVGMYQLSCGSGPDGSWDAYYRNVLDPQKKLPLGITEDTVFGGTMHEALEKMNAALISNGYLAA